MKMELGQNKTLMGHEVVEAEFGIGNMEVIMNILSSKMYSNPVKTICQEVMSNARDAHREAGKADVPIEVKLPNNLDRTFYIKDFGPGITPDRMANVFIRYAASTKRDDNTQTGGFGLGAKSPFSYVDTFGIITVTPEHQFTDVSGVCHESCLVRRQYVAIKAGKGKMTLQSAEVTTEAQGTTIVIACKPGDEGNFRKYVTSASEFWPVHPVIKGVSDFKWREHKVSFTADAEHDGFIPWRIDDRNNDYYSADQNTPLSIIDGIPYPLNVSNLYKDQTKVDQDINNIAQYPLRLFFRTGEVQMTATRDDLDYQPSVIKTLRKRVSDAVAGLRKQISDKIKGSKNLWEAHINWKDISYQYRNIITKAEWTAPDGKVIEIKAEAMYLRDYKANVFVFTRFGNEIKRRSQLDLKFSKGSVLAVEDTDVKIPSKLRIATLFDKDAALMEVQAITFTGLTPVDVQASKDKMEKELNLSLLEPVYLSTIPKKAIVRSAAGGFTVAKIKKFHNSSYRSENWKEANMDLEDGEGIYVELRGREAYLAGTQVLVSPERIQGFIASTNVDVYGIPTRYLAKIGDTWEKFQDKVQAEIDKLMLNKDLALYSDQIDNVTSGFDTEWSYISQSIRQGDGSKAKPKLMKDFIAGIDSATSVAKEYIEVSNQVANIAPLVEKLTSLNITLGKVNQPVKGKNTLSDLKMKFIAKYPLFNSLKGWESRNVNADDLLFYVNACDSIPKK